MLFKQNFTLFMLMMVLLLSLAACSGARQDDAAASPGGSAVDGCVLVTAVDVEALYHLPIAEPTKNENGEVGRPGMGFMSSCNYHTNADNFKTAGILARQSVNAKEALIAFQQGRSEAEKLGHQFQSMPAFGAEAYWDPDFGQLHLLKDNIWLIIRADAPDGSTALDAAGLLAQKAVSRLS